MTDPNKAPPTVPPRPTPVNPEGPPRIMEDSAGEPVLEDDGLVTEEDEDEDENYDDDIDDDGAETEGEEEDEDED